MPTVGMRYTGIPTKDFYRRPNISGRPLTNMDADLPIVED